MKFGDALELVKEHKKAKRNIWCDGSYIYLLDFIPVAASIMLHTNDEIKDHEFRFYISDLFADDWEVVE